MLIQFFVMIEKPCKGQFLKSKAKDKTNRQIKSQCSVTTAITASYTYHKQKITCKVLHKTTLLYFPCL